MKCTNCGAEIDGDICPSCNKHYTGSESPSLSSEKIEKESILEKEKEFDLPIPEPPVAKKKKSKRFIFEIVGGVLLVFFFFAALGSVPESDYKQLKTELTTLSSLNKQNEAELDELRDIKEEYSVYKERMKPYEALEKAEAEARIIEADKIAAEKKAADEKAAAEKKAQEEAVAKAAADKAAADKAAAEKAASASIGQKNALKTAKTYLGSMSFSYTGLIDQLKYEGYSVEDATYAVDNCGADWNQQAALTAATYMKSMSFSREGLIDQLQYEGFSAEQAAFGATSVGY